MLWAGSYDGVFYSYDAGNLWYMYRSWNHSDNSTSNKGLSAYPNPFYIDENNQYNSDGHVDQQSNLIAMLNRSYGANENVRHVNLGESLYTLPSVLLTADDLTFVWDGMHLTAAGNDVVATGLVEPVISMFR